MIARLRCLVPGCRRTLKPENPEDDQGICSKHWRLTDQRLRKLYRRCRRVERIEPGRRDHAIEVGTRVWGKLTIQAIERSMGL